MVDGGGILLIVLLNKERQARIENLLLMLTRGMRNDTGHSGVRHDTK